ncbi:peptidoglycan -binding protein [Caldovatus sp. SYSU G05006]|uniref:Peptidoglycan -binding protein n=2 Tax=Caldovatus aquaticus TaxID=2865671 RepID=A0ABS7F375_9PROT|nr:peptidoglycan -binding protein [Caldovatus aquaticus]
MVIIFVLLVFVLAQGFLSVALSSRDRALDRLHRQVAELGEMLALERGQAEELRASLGRTTEELRAAVAAREALARQLAGLREERDRLGAERDTARAERDRLAARLADLDLAARGNAERVATLEQRLAEALARAEAAGGDAARTVRELTETRRSLAQERGAREATERERAALGEQLAATRAQLAEARAALEATRRELAAMRQAAAELDRQVRADRETIEARLSDIARLNQQVQALTALRDELEREAREAMARAAEEARLRRAAEGAGAQAAARAEEAERLRQAAEAAAAQAGERAVEAERRAAEAERRRRAAESLAAEAEARAGEAARAREAAQAEAAEQTRLAESARAQLALLNRQIEALRAELARLGAALEAAEAAERGKDAQIANLGARLNAALAARVEELQQYRSDFFGRLRRILGDRPEVRVVGDRFVFQSEVLFPPASAELTPAGERSVRELARVLLEIARQIPPDIAWILRVDGHADRNPIRSPRFASNWELSAARAIAVVQLLIQEGLPPNRVAATAFGDTQPLDPGDTPEAHARNRRIELRLTDR